MTAVVEMLVAPAERAGIEIPENLEFYSIKEFPHWHIFSYLQLGTSMPTPVAHWENAKVIAQISKEKIFSITTQEIMDMGFQAGYPLP